MNHIIAEDELILEAESSLAEGSVEGQALMQSFMSTSNAKRYIHQLYIDQMTYKCITAWYRLAGHEVRGFLQCA